jgi:hypothetical protein
VLHSRTKHIEVRYHFLRNNVEKRNHCVESCPYLRSTSRHLYKASRPSYICAVAGGGNLGFVALSSWFLGDFLLYHMYHTMFTLMYIHGLHDV